MKNGLVLLSLAVHGVAAGKGIHTMKASKRTRSIKQDRQRVVTHLNTLLVNIYNIYLYINMLQLRDVLFANLI